MANFIIDKKDGYSIVSVLTDLDSQSTPELRSELVLLAGDSVKNMIIDLTDCHHCDATGLSAIMIAHRLCKEGFLILTGVVAEVEQILSIQRFDPPLMLLNDLEEGKSRMEALLSKA